MREAYIRGLLCCNFLFASCQLPLTSTPAPVTTPISSETVLPIPIIVQTANPVIHGLICEQLEQSLTIRPYTCVVEPSDEKVQRLTVEIELSDSQLDFGRNLGFSTVTAGTLLLVTSSARVDYSFTLEVPGVPTKKLNTHSTGRIGLWFILPPPKGLIFTSVGTLFNSSGAPDMLQDTCFSGNVSKDERKADCRLYRLFLSDSLNQIWHQLQTALFTDSELEKSSEEIPEKSLFRKESRVSSFPGASSSDYGFPDDQLSFLWGPAWYLSFYQGQIVDNSFGEIVLKGMYNYRPSYIETLAISRKLSTNLRKIQFEIEGQLGKHFGIQKHWETNLLLVLRWPILQDPIPVSIAYGDGLSYAEEIPKTELALGEVDTKRLLAYFMVELDIGLPVFPMEPRMLFRIHHRSGVYGLYCRKKCGSNFPAFGLKVKF